MRRVRFLALCRRRLLGVILAGGLAFASVGCHQHYHYYGSSACGPSTTTLPSTVQTGTICDEPTQVVDGATKVGYSSSRSTIVTGTKSSRVVLSEPTDKSPFSWKRSDPDSSSSLATSVQGGISDTTVK